LLFLLRGVDHTELITLATSTTIADSKSDSTLDDNLSEVFGIEIVEERKASPPAAKPKGSGLIKTSKHKPVKVVATKKKKKAPPKSKRHSPHSPSKTNNR
jgi:hypothetical protein